MTEVGDPKPCPYCGKSPEVHMVGSYVEGFQSYVYCVGYECGVRGPGNITGSFSHDEQANRNSAVEAWNRMNILE